MTLVILNNKCTFDTELALHWHVAVRVHVRDSLNESWRLLSHLLICCEPHASGILRSVRYWCDAAVCSGRLVHCTCYVVDYGCASSSRGGKGGGGKLPTFIFSSVPGNPNKMILSFSLIWIISIPGSAPFSTAKSRKASKAFCSDPEGNRTKHRKMV